MPLPLRRARVRAMSLALGVLAILGAKSAPLSAQPAEPYRPAFHFAPPKNWINDPNGMVWYQGEWHLFYQHNPFGDKWGHMSWGHAVSRDLTHWEHLPVAIPEENGVMIFSGSAVVDRYNTSGLCRSTVPGDSSCLVAIYTGHTETNQSQHVAVSNDRGRTWTKYAGNPVIDIGAKDFRDPKVFWHAPSKQWVMVVSIPLEHKVRFYGSPNLTRWTQLGEFGPAGMVHGIWECPDLFEVPVDGQPGRTKWVLIVNFNPGAPAGGSGTQYFVGRFDGHRFISDDPPTRTRFVDYGADFYAGVSWSDVPAADGRRVWLAWMSNWDYAQDEPTAPFRGTMTVPRTLTLRRDGRDLVLVQRPVRELERLRGSPVNIGRTAIAAGQQSLTERGVRGETLDLEVDLIPGSAAQSGIVVRAGGAEATFIGYDADSKQLFIDRRRSGQTSFHAKFSGTQSGPVALMRGHLRLRVLVDRSSVEVFANGVTVLSDRIFPSPGSDGVGLFARGGTATLQSLTAWPMADASR